MRTIIKTSEDFEKQIKEYFISKFGSNLAESMVFISDPEYKWEITND